MFFPVAGSRGAVPRASAPLVRGVLVFVMLVAPLGCEGEIVTTTDDAPAGEPGAAVDEAGGAAGTGGQGGKPWGGAGGGGGRGGSGGVGAAGQAGAGGRPATTPASGGAAGSVQEPDNAGGGAGTSAPDLDDQDEAARVVPVFVAIGAGRRIAVSCDDGRSWFDAQEGGAGDEHHSDGVPQGLAAGNNRFVAAFGWGAKGRVLTSADAVAWKEVATNTEGYAGAGFDGTAFLTVDSRRPMRSADGVTWESVAMPPWTVHVRRIVGLPAPAGRGDVFIVGYAGAGGSAEERQLARSDNGGASWAVTNLPDCVFAQQREGGLACNGSTCVAVGRDGKTCRSVDRGRSWRSSGATGSDARSLLWTGNAFVVYEGDRMHESADGLTWAEKRLEGGEGKVDRVVRAPDGTFVAVAADGTRFFRSTDGRAWIRANGPEGRWLRHLSFGLVRPSTRCP